MADLVTREEFETLMAELKKAKDDVILWRGLLAVTAAGLHGTALELEGAAETDRQGRTDEELWERITVALARGRSVDCLYGSHWNPGLWDAAANALTALLAELSARDELLLRIREWDQLPDTADGPYWIREIDRVRAASGGGAAE